MTIFKSIIIGLIHKVPRRVISSSDGSYRPLKQLDFARVYGDRILIVLPVQICEQPQWSTGDQPQA